LSCVRQRTDGRPGLGHLDRTTEELMKPQTLMASFCAAALAFGCASHSARLDSYGPATRSNEGYYGVIASIEGGPADSVGLAGREIGNAGGGQDDYSIRVRFDDRSFQTVRQGRLDGLRVGDSVRIEDDRVRHY
jgi:hypothetical protein